MTASTMLLACTGHVLIDLPIFMGPVVVLAGWLGLMTRRARRNEREGSGRTGGTGRASGGGQAIRDNLMEVHP